DGRRLDAEEPSRGDVDGDDVVVAVDDRDADGKFVEEAIQPLCHEWLRRRRVARRRRRVDRRATNGETPDRTERSHVEHLAGREGESDADATEDLEARLLQGEGLWQGTDRLRFAQDEVAIAAQRE